MLLNQELLNMIAQDLTSQNERKIRNDFYDRHLMYNGKSLEVIKKSFRAEFKKKDTIDQLETRITPINLTAKIINKLSGVYAEAPFRYPIDQNDIDQELIGLYEDELKINTVMKEANRQFNQFKTFLLEFFIDEKAQCPGIRSLPRHTYKVYSVDTVRPEVPNIFCKIIKDSIEPKEMIISVCTDESWVVIDGAGNTIPDKMVNNPDGLNPYGIAPYIFGNKSSSTLYPEQDDDLHRMAIVIPVLLSDLNLATKFQCWSIIAVIGGTIGDVPFSPNSIIEIPNNVDGTAPSIEVVKPTVDTDKIITLVTNLITLLLSTNDLSSNTIRTAISGAQDLASGISKAVDSAETAGVIKEQQQYFNQIEYALWDMLANHLVPYWREKGLLEPELDTAFTEDFDLGIIYKDPKASMTPKERIEIESMKLEKGFTTLKRALVEIYPEMNETEIDILAQEIKAEKLDTLARQLDGLQADSQMADQSNGSGQQNL